MYPNPLALSPETTASTPPRPRSFTLTAAALAALSWNAYGVAQFLQSVRSTPDTLMKMGMTAEQARVYASYPAWMTAAFALGVFGGLVGSALLLARRRAAVAVFAASLAGYVVLYIGDVTEGVFAALGAPQVTVLTTVVAIATALFAWSRSLAKRGALR